MRHATSRLLLLCFALTLAGCGADDPTRSNTYVPLTAIAISSEHDGIADLTDNLFTATGDYSGAFSGIITNDVIWTSSDTSVLTIGATGLATAVAPGTATVNATLDGISGSFPFTVSAAVVVAPLTVTPATQSAPIGVERDFDVSGTFDDGSVQNLNRIAAWSSLDPAVASVTGTGGATGLSVGTAGIQAEWQGITGTATLTVTEAVLTNLAITPADAEYPAGLIIQYRLTGSYSDSTSEDLTAQAIWEASIETRATVNNTAGEKGKVETLSSGTTDITAFYADALSGGQEVSTDLRITSATLREILLSATVFDAGGLVDRVEEISAGETLDIFDDQTVAFTATGEYTDNSEHEITAQSSWSSSDTKIITISNSSGFEGIAAPGINTGLADIRAAFGTLDITFTIDVNPR